MSEEKWVVMISTPRGNIYFVSPKSASITAHLDRAKAFDDARLAKQERDLLAARIAPSGRDKIEAITYDEAVARVTAREITSG